MTNFDKHIKKELENLSQNYVPDDWLAMETLLRETAFDQHINQKIQLHEEIITTQELELFDNFLNIKAFDNFVQHKIELIEAAEMEPDWESFEANLATQTFDKLVSHKIETVATGLAVADWEMFEQKLEEKIFDSTIKEKIETHTASYHNSDWKMMRRLLERLNPQPNYIWDKTKRLLPFLLLFLFVGSAALWINNMADVQKPIATVHLPKKSVVSPPEIKAANPLEKQQIVENKTKRELLVGTQTTADKVQTTPDRTQKDLFVERQTTADKVQTTPDRTQNTLIKAGLPFYRIVQKTSDSTQKDLIVEAQIKAEKDNTSFISPQETNVKEKGISSSYSKTNIQKANYQAVKINPTVNANNLNYQLNALNGDNWNPQFSVGLYTAALGSLVELNDTLRIGAATGLRTALSLNEKWSLTTDVLYAKRNFETQYYKLYRPTDMYLQHLLIGNITTIDIPIMIKYKWNLDKKGHLGIYMQAGAVPTISLDEDYTHYDPTTIENIGKNWDGNLREMAPVKQAFHFKPYMGNVIVAPGVQYQVGQFRFQAEPRFQWAIQAMSVENKKIHSMGIGISAVYAFAKK